MKKKSLPKNTKRLLAAALIMFLFCGCYILGVNFYVILSQKKNILSTQEAARLDKVDYVLVLGCGVKEDGEPSHMLYERLKTGAEVWKNQSSALLLLTGDNSGESLGTHNTFLTVMVMSGYVGGVLFALFLIAVFLDLLRVRNLIPLAFLMELLMHSYTESGMDYYAYIPLILALVLARYISYQSDDITSLFR